MKILLVHVSSIRSGGISIILVQKTALIKSMTFVEIHTTLWLSTINKR